MSIESKHAYRFGSFSQELRKWRLEKNLLVKQAVDALGTNMGTYTSWEYGARTPKPMSLPEIRRRMAAVKPQPEIHQK